MSARRRASGSAPGPQEGFTLVEVMVALALLGLLMTGIYTVAVGTLVAQRRIEQSAAVFTAGPEILDIIEKDLRGAYLHGVADLKSFVAIRKSVGGSECTWLDLVTTTNSKVSVEVDDRLVRSDLTEVGYRLRRSDEVPDVLELYRREQFFFDDDLDRGGDYHLVYDRVRLLVMDFFEDPETGETTSSLARDEGKESWDSSEAEALPHAVRITLELAPPAELAAGDLAEDDRSYRFVRWVLMPTALDRVPAREPEGEGGNPRGNRGGEDD